LNNPFVLSRSWVLLTTPAFAAREGKSPVTLRDWIPNGKLAAVKGEGQGCHAWIARLVETG
jgi:hypothetical protein